jgi:lysozyme
MVRFFEGEPFSSTDIDPNDYAAMLRRHAADVGARTEAASSATPPDRRLVADLTTSPNGMTFIKGWEGEHGGQPKLAVYPDAVGKPTIGWGHLVTDPSKYPGRISAEQAQDIFDSDLAKHEAIVRRIVKVPLSQHEFDAMVALTFNLPQAMTGKHSALRDKLNAGDYEGAAAELPRWNHGAVDGELVPIDGLTRRRRAEQEVFRTGVYSGP